MTAVPAQAAHRPKADRRYRLMAFALDALLLGIPYAVMLILAPFRALGPIQESSGFAWLYGSVVLVFQSTLAMQGQTFGQAALGLELLERTGNRASWPRTSLRNVIALWLWIPFVVDPLARTYLAQVRETPSRSRVRLWGSTSTVALLGVALTILYLPKAPSAETIDWVRQRAITLEPDHHRPGSSPLADLAGEARVVALGEATHGSRDTTLLKQRFLETMVWRKGANVFAIEADFAEALAVNQYVLEGIGDPALALKNLGFWTTGTGEMLDLVRWMRSYNQDPGHARKVKFYGIDMQSPERAFAVARTYLAGRSDKDRVWAEKELSPPAEKNYASASLGLPEAYLGLAEKMSIRFKEMAGHRHEEEAFQVAERCVEVLRQGCRLALAGTMAGAVRDSYMAENVLWILAHEGPDSKAVLSAHNGHVSFAPEALDGAASLGAHLRRKLGRRLVVCGFAFNEGDYLAHGATGLKAFHAGKAQPGSLDHGLAKCGLTEYALDLRATNERPLPAWFGQRRPARSIGAVSWGCQAFSYQILVPADHFDILVFQRTIHPSSLLLEGL